MNYREKIYNICKPLLDFFLDPEYSSRLREEGMCTGPEELPPVLPFDGTDEEWEERVEICYGGIDLQQ